MCQPTLEGSFEGSRRANAATPHYLEEAPSDEFLRRRSERGSQLSHRDGIRSPQPALDAVHGARRNPGPSTELSLGQPCALAQLPEAGEGGTPVAASFSIFLPSSLPQGRPPSVGFYSP